MSAYADAQTTGGYGEGSSSSGSADGAGNFWQSLVGNAVNRYMDIETYKQTGGQVPPSYYTQGQAVKSQYLNTGTVSSYNQTVAGVPMWALAVGAVVLVLVLRK
jgi:hypothetical protein